MALRFGDLAAKETAARHGKRAERVRKTVQALGDKMKLANFVTEAMYPDKRRWFAKECPHCKRFPWEHSATDWECPTAGLWMVNVPGVTDDILREAVRQILREELQ